MPSAASKARIENAEKRDSFGNTWVTPLTGTCSARPGFFCYALFCCYCASYTNRKEYLRGDMTRYVCCNGHCPCSGKMKEDSCPEFCLCLEVFCCFNQSVASTRWGIQDQLQIKNTKCDNCIIGTMVFLRFASCICNIVACLTQIEAIDQAADALECLADAVWCTVCACMQTQAKVEMSENQRWLAAAPAGAYAAPPQQQMAYVGQPAAYPAAGQPPAQPTMQYERYPAAGPPQYPPPQGYPGAR